MMDSPIGVVPAGFGKRPCPGCSRLVWLSVSDGVEDLHAPACPAMYEPGTPAFHELTEMKIDRLLGRYQ